MYNNDKDLDVNAGIGDIIYYFIDNYVNETNIIVKDNKTTLSEMAYNMFYNYLYELGLDLPRYVNGYNPPKPLYIIKNVISTFIIEHNIDLTKYIDNFEKLYPKAITFRHTIDIVNYFSSTYSRPWKGWCDYMNEFMDFFEKLDTEYKRPDVVNMMFEDVNSFVNQLCIKDIDSKPEEVQKLYCDMWWNLYSDKYDNPTNDTDMKFMVYAYFINNYYKPWKHLYNYEHEWKDYIETLNID